MKTQQQGMTLIGMLSTLAFVVMFGLILMKVVPVYLENYEVKHSIRTLATLDADNFSMDPRSNMHVLMTKLMNQLYISGIDMIKREDVTITPLSATRYAISLEYSAKRQLIGNLSIVVEFKEKEEIDISVK